MKKLSNMPVLSRYIVTLSIIFIASASWASTGDPVQSDETLLQDEAEEECYCSVRKQQQVERRLEKQKLKELEQE